MDSKQKRKRKQKEMVLLSGVTAGNIGTVKKEKIKQDSKSVNDKDNSATEM